MLFTLFHSELSYQLKLGQKSLKKHIVGWSSSSVIPTMSLRSGDGLPVLLNYFFANIFSIVTLQKPCSVFISIFWNSHHLPCILFHLKESAHMAPMLSSFCPGTNYIASRQTQPYLPVIREPPVNSGQCYQTSVLLPTYYGDERRDWQTARQKTRRGGNEIEVRPEWVSP